VRTVISLPVDILFNTQTTVMAVDVIDNNLPRNEKRCTLSVRNCRP